MVPSKVYGLMAAGRPMLYVGPEGGTPARLIRRFGCGWQVELGDVAGLVAVLRWLSENPEEVEKAGRGLMRRSGSTTTARRAWPGFATSS